MECRENHMQFGRETLGTRNELEVRPNSVKEAEKQSPYSEEIHQTLPSSDQQP